MPAGRPPKPTAVLRLQGTFRKDRHARRDGEPQPPKPSRVPVPPSYLDAEGKAEWRRVAKELHAVGLLTTIDRAALAGYCASFARARAAEKALETRGLTMVVKGMEMQRPEVAIARAAWSEVRRFATEFGMTPSARTRVKPAKPLDPKTRAEEEKMERFFGNPFAKINRRGSA